MFENWREWKIKGQISSSSLIPVYTIHLPTVHVRTKFQPSRPHSSWEKCDEKFQCLKIGEKEKWIKRPIHISVYTIHLPTVHMCTKFQSSRPHSFWEKYDEKFLCLKIGEKEKWRNKGTNKQEQPDSGVPVYLVPGDTLPRGRMSPPAYLVPGDTLPWGKVSPQPNSSFI